MDTTHNDRRVETGRFLGLLFDHLGEEERIEGRWTRPGSGGQMFRDFFLTPDEFARKAFSIAFTHDVYVGVAARNGNVGTKDGVKRLRAIWADLDFKDGHTPQSRDSQLRGLDCVPSMSVLSGGGCHVYWLLVEPIEGPEWLNRAEMVMARIGEGLAGDPVQDLPRILRVPGTYNHKTGKPRPVELAYCNPRGTHTKEHNYG